MRIGLAFKACLEPLFLFPHCQFSFPHFFFLQFPKKHPYTDSNHATEAMGSAFYYKGPIFEVKKIVVQAVVHQTKTMYNL